MPQKFRPGSVCRLPGTGGRGREAESHRIIIVVEDTETDDFLVIPICSLTEESDRTCVLQVNEMGGLIERLSFVAYHWAKKLPANHFKSVSEPIGELSEAVLLRVVQGIFDSDECEPWFQNALQKALRGK